MRTIPPIFQPSLRALCWPALARWLWRAHGGDAIRSSNQQLSRRFATLAARQIVEGVALASANSHGHLPAACFQHVVRDGQQGPTLSYDDRSQPLSKMPNWDGLAQGRK